MAAATLALAGGWLTALGAPGAVATVGGLPAWLVLTALVRIVRTAAALPFASLLLPAPWSAIAGGLTGIADRARCERRLATGPAMDDQPPGGVGPASGVAGA